MLHTFTRLDLFILLICKVQLMRNTQYCCFWQITEQLKNEHISPYLKIKQVGCDDGVLYFAIDTEMTHNVQSFQQQKKVSLLLHINFLFLSNFNIPSALL